MRTPNADSAADTVVDTGITKSLALTGPGSSPSDDSCDDTCLDGAFAGSVHRSELTWRKEVVVLARTRVVQLPDEGAECGRVLRCQHDVELQRGTR